MKNAYIFGASGHANVIASIIKNRYNKIYFVDLAKTTGNIINEEEFFNQMEKYANDNIFLGIGSNKIRTKLFDKIATYKRILEPTNCISDGAYVSHDAKMGEGNVICHGSLVGSNAKIGNNTIINSLSSVDHDCILGDNSQVTAGVTFGGGVVVGKNCFFGVKSAIVPLISIGDNSIIMAGSIVYKDVPKNVMVGGNPARIMKNL